MSSLVYLHLTLVKAMLPYLLRDKIMPCDLHLLFSKIAAHIDHLHPVLQRRLDGVDVVGCSDEKHIRKIVIDIEIIVVESRILLRIKSSRLEILTSNKYLSDLYIASSKNIILSLLS